MEDFLVDNVPVAVLVWCALYLSDYYLTLYAARLYQQGAREHIVFEGSYELTPFFQKDIDGLRRISARFLFAMILYSVIIVVEWFALVRIIPLRMIYILFLGALVTLELTIHLRHFRNIVTFRQSRNADIFRGRIEYPRWYVLQSSAFEFFGFAVLYSILSLLLSSWFLAGGVLACFVTGFKHWRLSRAQRVSSQAPV